MSEALGYIVLLGGLVVWLYMAYYVTTDARGRGSRLWPLHAIGTLAMGLGWLIPYWLVTRRG